MSGTNAMAQRTRTGGFSGFGGGGSSLLEIAARPEVAKHLEFLPDQIADLKKVRDDENAGRRERFRGLFSGFDRNASEEDQNAARANIQKAIQQAAADQKNKVAGILLPHQFVGLEQLLYQWRMRDGLGSLFRSEEMTAKIGVTTTRKREELASKYTVAQAEIRAALKKLQKEMEERFLQENLTQDEHGKYKKMVGPPFVFVQQPRGQGGFGQGRGGETGGGRNRGGQERGDRTNSGRPSRPGQ
jgi:hypothetical protein